MSNQNLPAKSAFQLIERLESECANALPSNNPVGVGFVELENSHKAVILSNVWGPTS